MLNRLWLKAKHAFAFSKIEIAFLFFWYIVMVVIWRRMFVFDGESYWSGWDILWADWSAHITYVLNMSYRSLLLTSHPLYAGLPFRYHFVADFVSAVLLRFGFSLVQALIIPSVICSFMLVTCVYLFFRYIFVNIKTAMISSLLFLCNGGLGFVWYIYYLLTQNPAVQKSASIFRFTQIEEVRIEYTNLLIGYFIPQRSFLLGFPISIVIMLYFILLTIKPTMRSQKYIVFILGILTGLFPIIHLYAYAVIMSVITFLFIYNLIVRKSDILSWLYFFCPAIIIGIGLYLHYWGFDGIHQIQFKPFWPMNGNLAFWLYYCIINGGLIFLLAPVSLYFTNRKIKIVSIPFILIFFASNIFIFQPYAWDNGKFMAYACLWNSGLVGNFLSQILERNIKSESIKAGIILTIYFCIFSGAMDIANLTQFSHQKNHFFSQRDLNMGERIRKLVPYNDVILTAPYNSYISMLAGRQLFMGNRFWVNSYGIQTIERENDIRSIYEGSISAPTILKRYNIQYLIISPTERSNLLINENYISKNFTMILNEGDIKLYKINQNN